jgi:hypothetical protein
VSRAAGETRRSCSPGPCSSGPSPGQLFPPPGAVHGPLPMPWPPRCQRQALAPATAVVLSVGPPRRRRHRAPGLHPRPEEVVSA